MTTEEANVINWAKAWTRAKTTEREHACLKQLFHAVENLEKTPTIHKKKKRK